MKFIPYVKLQKDGRMNKSSRMEMRKKVYQKYGKNCYLCGRILDSQTGTVDHIHPLTMWGTNNIENLRPCCHACNQRKGRESLYDFCENYVREQAIQSFCKNVTIPDSVLT